MVFISSLAVTQSRWPLLFHFMQCLTFMEVGAQYAATSHIGTSTLAGPESTVNEGQGVVLILSN